MFGLICALSLALQYLAEPANYAFENSTELVGVYAYKDFNAEVLIQNNGPGTIQKVIKVIPKDIGNRKCPAVVVPYYFPEAMLGTDLSTGVEISGYEEVEMMLHLVKRGFICISAESYHLTYCRESVRARDDFSRWKEASGALLRDYPQWCGIGKMVADTRLLIDLLESDSRVKKNRIGIAGHSLGGKIAFYTGCLDSRIKVILASDFGLLWTQSNWESQWYWGTKLEDLETRGFENVDLWEFSGFRPFCLIAGESDNDESYRSLSDRIRKTGGSAFRNLQFVNHATGHRPPWHVLEQGYVFLEKYLK